MEKILKLNSNEEAIALYGSLDETLRFAEKEYRVRISARNHRLKISGDKSGVEQAHRFFVGRLNALRQTHHHPIAKEDSSPRHTHPHSQVKSDSQEHGGTPRFFHKGKIIAPKSKNQAKYLEAIRDQANRERVSRL